MRCVCQILSVLFICFLTSQIVPVHAASLQFSGTVPARNPDQPNVTEFPRTLISFSDQVALSFPLDFNFDGRIRVFNDLGKPAKGLRLLSLASENGVRTRVAVVDLLPSTGQTFLLCDGERCIRYKVVRN